LIDEGRVGSIADNLAGRVVLHHDEKDVIGLVSGESGRRSGGSENRGRQHQSGSRELVRDVQFHFLSGFLPQYPTRRLLRPDELRQKNAGNLLVQAA
jgi:hypothetical protein